MNDFSLHFFVIKHKSKSTIMGSVKFVADHMLGKLAKYLRFMGYDVFYPDGKMSDEDIISIAKKEGRVILTRDKELAKISGGVYIESDDFRVQLRQVVKQFNLDMNNALTRCSICNAVLEEVKDKSIVKGRVPDYVYSTHSEFYICPKCGRIYWWGTHTEKIENTLRNVLEMENGGKHEN